MMLALPEGRYRLSYNGSIRIAPALRSKTVIWKSRPSMTPLGDQKRSLWDQS
jgi:hypothetical protein